MKQHLSEFFLRLTKHSKESTTIFEDGSWKKGHLTFMKMAPGNKKGSYTYNLRAGVQSLSYITACIKV
jgi:hypothetical protein